MAWVWVGTAMATKPHCPVCSTYEEGVMAARKEGIEPPEDLQPCADYEMTDRFRDWLTEALRREVFQEAAVAVPTVMGDSKQEGDEDEEEGGGESGVSNQAQP